MKTKVDPEEVRDYVKRLKEAGLEHGALAQAGRDFGISRSRVHWIVNGQNKEKSENWWENKSIDWTKSNQDIGRLVGMNQTAVNHMRLRLGKPSKRVITFTY